MKRAIYDDLLKWKGRRSRKPLLLEGVRQCGKTYILKKFGEENYEDVAYFTFEKNPGLCNIFRNDLDPARIIHQLGMVRNKKIEPGKTLIIFDEIQFCNRAITSLKFFCEEAPEHHVVCAGSLLGVMLSRPYSFPVGKVNRLRMGPMSFKEFLLAHSEDMLVGHIDSGDPTEPLPSPIADRLNTYLDYYLAVGGMPAAVASWIEDGDIGEVEAILGEIIEDYEDDFAKHAPEHIEKLTLIWRSIPGQLAKDNSKFMFSHVRTGARSKDLEGALEWLIDAGLVYKVKRVDRPVLPLSMSADNMNFKVYMADVGILRKLAGIPAGFVFGTDKEHDAYRGAAAENYVLCELVASNRDVPCYWRSGGTAEVDFVAQIEGAVVPIEVKAGGNKSKSLYEFIKKHNPEIAVAVSARSGRTDSISYIPLHSAWKVRDHVLGSVGERRTGGPP